ncbi:MAG: hypothetical protein ACLSUW_08980 [Akkermansia sp.]
MIGERVALFANAARTSAPNFGYKDENNKELTNSWRTDQMEFGFRVSPVDKVWFSASWFDIIQNNTPVILPGSLDRYYADGSKRAEGVELSLTGEITKNWSSYLSYTYTRTKNRTTGEVYPTIAPNALALWQKYRIDGGLLNSTVLGWATVARIPITPRSEARRSRIITRFLPTACLISPWRFPCRRPNG